MLLELEDRSNLPRTLVRRSILLELCVALGGEGGLLTPRAEKEVATLLVVPDRDRAAIRSTSLDFITSIIELPFRFILIRMFDSLLWIDDVPECTVGVERPDELYVTGASGGDTAAGAGRV